MVIADRYNTSAHNKIREMGSRGAEGGTELWHSTATTRYTQRKKFLKTVQFQPKMLSRYGENPSYILSYNSQVNFSIHNFSKTLLGEKNMLSMLSIKPKTLSRYRGKPSFVFSYNSQVIFALHIF